MRKFISLMVMIMVLCAAFSAYAAEGKLLDIRSRIFDESRQIKALMPESKDPIMVNNMWNSCLMTITQLDAYFSLIGIFNTLKKDDVSKASVDYLITWLGEIKATNEMNIKSLNSFPASLESNTKQHLEKLRAYFAELNIIIALEINKNTLLKKAVKK